MHMPSLFTQVFACCIRNRSRSPPTQAGGPDEQTHLIPPTNEVPPVRTYVVDHQKMRERLGTIVRAKEGKMVNVNAPVPFNLHNRALHTLDPSATRSRSVSADDVPGAAVQQHRVPSYSPLRDESPSLLTSRSTSSLHPGDASYLPPEADPENRVRKPVFSVRLVRPTSAGIWTRRGRSVTRGRYSRFGEERSAGRRNGENEACDGDGNGHRNESEAEEEVSGEVEGNGKPSNGDADTEQGEDAADTPRPDGHPASTSTAHQPILSQAPMNSAGDDDRRAEEDAEASGDSGGTPRPPNFQIQIQDVGKISQSWGD